MTKHHLITLIVFAREKNGREFNDALESTRGYRRKSVADLKALLKSEKES